MRALHEQGWGLSERESDVCPFIPLAGCTWESYLASLGRDHRYNLGRRFRKLEQRSEVSFEQVRGEDERREALANLFRLHDLRWRGRGGSEAFDSPGVRAFHEDVSRTALERGWLRLFTLRLDRDPSAVLYAFRYGRTFSYYQSGFDPRFAKLSVGLVTLGLAIRSAIVEGAAEFDFLHGDEAYKFHWARQTRALGRIEAYPRNAAALAARGLICAERAGRRLVHHLLPRPITEWIRLAYRTRVRRAFHAATAR
jgi:CelD/BcsL family acetyltransferase involved in cellulose biosynthesis